MCFRLYAMDTHFMPSGLEAYPLDDRYKMMADIGYDGVYFPIWGVRASRELSSLQTSVDRAGLPLAGVYAPWDLSLRSDEGINAVVMEGFIASPPCRTIDLSLTFGNVGHSSSCGNGDGIAVDHLHELVDLAERYDRRIALYPHVGFWMERVDDCIRIANLVNHPRVGCAFGSFHWMAAEGANLGHTLTAVAPRLMSVNISGTKPTGATSGLRISIAPAGEGALDLLFLVSMLSQLGYDDWIGVQGYGIKGDPYLSMAQSYRVLQDTLSRVSDHDDLEATDFEPA